ncbi:LOW QUALITY PROTEIN: hypothetical protein Cgig2_002086 [Carnegiea gigantea]|uniref:Uncharacterized protein n=1 Tax=Carnegiea gigantea TaxID=171969 RepID=A0A9Q1JUM2_9CARY|nr:LOW QUALITY PROTEIN: hypothetical protein Cgig2_002086 [Carnegiea gigantea]
MWANHVNFLPIIIKVLPSHSNAFSLLNLKKYMDQIRVKLKNWLDRNCNKSNRNHSPNQMQRSISLLQQQSKQEWIKYGDANSRLFFAKSKQRKLATYIYSIKDDTGTWVEGFVKVGQVMLNFYKDLLGHHPTTGSPIDPAIIQLGPQLSKEQQVALSWVFVHHRLPTKQRLNYRHGGEFQQLNPQWKGESGPSEKLKGIDKITYAIFTAVIYHIWSARNHALPKKQTIPVRETIKNIKEQILHRVLSLNIGKKKHSMHTDRLLQ